MYKIYKAKLFKTILVSTAIFIGMLSATQITHAEGILQCSGEVVKYSYNEFIKQEAGTKVTGFNIDTARVVEITESLPGENLTGAGTKESIIVDAYKGSCCTKPVKNKSCDEIADIYTLNDSAGLGLTECEKVTGSTLMCVPVQLLISMSGVSLLKFYVLQIYIWAASIVGLIAVLIMVISGIQIAASGGTDQVSSAKTRITSSLSGLAILFLSALILYTINPTFFTR